MAFIPFTFGSYLEVDGRIIKNQDKVDGAFIYQNKILKTTKGKS